MIIIRRALLRACQITSSSTTFKIEQDTDTTSVWSKNRTRNKHNNSRTEATTLQLLVLLLNCCLLLLLLVQLLFITQTIFDFRGAVREPWAMTVCTCFTFRGYLFSACFLALVFFTKKQHLSPTGPQKWLPNPSQTWPWTYFLWFFAHAVFAALRSVFNGFHCSHLLKNTQKTTHKQSLENTMKKHDDFMRKNNKSAKKTPKWGPNKWVFTRKISLWHLWWHLWRLRSFFCSKNVAKVLQKWSQACKSDSKRESKVIKVGAR